MRPELTTRRDGTTRPRRKGAVNGLLVAWMTLVWVALWQDASPFVLLCGVLLAVGVQLAFPLPRVRIDGRVDALAFAGFVGFFVVQVCLSSLQVARHVLRVGSIPRNAVIAVDLRSDSDFILTAVGIVTSLIPGSVVVEARRSSHTLFIHALGVCDAAGVERERARVLDTEARLVRAFGIRLEQPGVRR